MGLVGISLVFYCMVQEKTEICVMHQNLSPKWDGKASSTRIVGRPTGLLLIEPYVHVGLQMQVGNEVRPILLIFVTNLSLRAVFDYRFKGRSRLSNVERLARPD